MKKTTIADMCASLGIPYGMLFGPDRSVNLVESGGHRKIRREDTRRGDLYIDTNLLHPGTDDERTLEMLVILAVDLDCLEAGESLAGAGIVEPQLNGRYCRIEPRNT